MKITIKTKTKIGINAIEAEFIDLKALSAQERADLEKLFKIVRTDFGVVLEGSPVTDYVQPWALRSKIIGALAMSGAKEHVDYNLRLD